MSYPTDFHKQDVLNGPYVTRLSILKNIEGETANNLLFIFKSRLGLLCLGKIVYESET